MTTPDFATRMTMALAEVGVPYQVSGPPEDLRGSDWLDPALMPIVHKAYVLAGGEMTYDEYCEWAEQANPGWRRP